MSSPIYVAVRRYNKITGAPVGVPLQYPEKIIYLGRSQTPPDNSGDWEVMTEFECATLKKSLKTEWTTYQTGVSAQKYIATRITAAMDFGKKIMAEYGAANVYSGKTVAEVKTIATKLSTLQALLLSGSLYAALDEIDIITSDSLVTDQVKAEFKAKIRKYLGI
jgi:long-subunit fatty acid transport protein